MKVIIQIKTNDENFRAKTLEILQNSITEKNAERINQNIVFFSVVDARFVVKKLRFFFDYNQKIIKTKNGFKNFDDTTRVSIINFKHL